MEDEPKPKPPVMPAPHTTRMDGPDREWVAAMILVVTVIVMVCVAIAAVVVYAMRPCGV